MFKPRNKQMPPFIQDMFSVSVRDFYYNIRRSENILHVPNPRTDYLSEVLGIQRLSFEIDCHPNYVSC